MKKKKRFSKLFCLFLIISLLIIWGYNNLSLRTAETTLTTEKATDEIRIALVSDLHYSVFYDNDKVIRSIEETKPDLIFVLGDMYSRGMTERIDRVINFLDRLSEIADVYAVTGDHDYDDEYKQELKALQNVHLLDYIYRDIELKGTKLRIYGIDNVYFSDTFDLGNEFEKPPADRLNILLSHIPSMPHYGDFGFDYIFCGDTHGGMVRLPWFGGLYYDGYILPKITYSGIITDKGLYEFENTSLYVTSGVGNYPLPLRFNNRPEICLIKIKGE
ncbi:MAG: metallophosphoesterase [Clostridia bacterium]|nr:metallophosphoesterase [Clostridia bacterium]